MKPRFVCGITVWDGDSPGRDSDLGINAAPDGPAWTRLIKEVAGTQTQVNLDTAAAAAADAKAVTAQAAAATADAKAVTADGKAVAAQAAAATADAKAVTADGKAVAAQAAAATADAKAVTADGKAVAAQADATTALADAATADGKAVAAQADATTALADAATADAKAVTADGKAVAAQADATTALADAATADGKAVAAQADATTALADAAAAQADATTALADAATADGKAVAAQADATTAIADAAAAQADATTALADAAAAQADATTALADAATAQAAVDAVELITAGNDPNTTHDKGTKGAAAGISVVEKGDGAVHKTVITLATVAVTITDGTVPATDAAWGTIPLYTFPQGHIVILGAHEVFPLGGIVAVTGGGGGLSDTADLEIGVGTAARANASNFALGATEDDIIPGQAGVDLVAKASDAIESNPLGAALFYDGSAAAVVANLNVCTLDDGDSGVNSDTLNVSGTITIIWTIMGDD